MPLSHCRYWIFDMDGTLTLPVHDFNAIRDALGIESGRPILEAISEMDPDEAQAISKRLHELEMEIAALAKPQPGAATLLERIKARGDRLGILTRNDEEIADATLRASGLHDFFDTADVIGRETCAPKPSPDGVQYLLDRWDAAPDLAVMVGDYLFDIEAGHRAGVNTIHFDSAGQFDWPDFTSHGVCALADIGELFRN